MEPEVEMEETIRDGADSLDPDWPEGEEEPRSQSSRTVLGTAAA